MYYWAKVVHALEKYRVPTVVSNAISQVVELLTVLP